MSIFEDLLSMAHVEREPDYQVSAQGIRSIRRAITFGIHAMAQVESTLRSRDGAELLGTPWPEGITVPVIAGESFAETVAEMADALLWIEHASHIKEARDDAATA